MTSHFSLYTLNEFQITSMFDIYSLTKDLFNLYMYILKVAPVPALLSYIYHLNELTVTSIYGT